MRVAVCFSGLPRLHAHNAILAWHRIISKYSADVFIHTWINTDQHNSIDNRLAGEFKPKILKYEPLRKLNVDMFTDRIWPTADAYRMLSGFIGIRESIGLAIQYAEHQHFEYDFIIRGRFDVAVDTFELEPVECNGVVVPDDPDKHGLQFTYRGEQLWGINDLIAYGSSQAMHLYSITDQHMHSLYRDEGVDVCPEIFLTASLKKQQVPIMFQKINHHIVRTV